MLKKGKPIKFSRSGTIMERVFQAVLDGHTTKQKIVVYTSIPFQTVSTALYGLTYSGNLVMIEGKVNRYTVPGQEVVKITTESIAESTPAQTLIKNSIQQVKKGGRPLLDEPRKVVYVTVSEKAHEAYLLRGGARWFKRLLEGLA